MSSIDSTLHLDLVDTDGNAVSLDTGRSTFLYFMRAPTCPQCNSAARTLAAERDSLRLRGVDVVIALPTDTQEAAAWKAAKAIPLTVVTGRSGTAHEHAGLLRRVFGLIQQSGGILVDDAGRVRYQHIATNPGDSLRMKELVAAIDALPAID